jgi:hypothetical protein
MRSRLWPTWTWPPLLSVALALTGCGAGGWKPKATPTPIAPAKAPVQTLVSRDGSRFVPGTPPAGASEQRLVGWSRVRLEEGRLTLSGTSHDLSRIDHPCTRIHHIELGPPSRGLRLVSVFLAPSNPECEKTGSRPVVLEPNPPWSADTAAVPTALDVPDPRFTEQRRLSAVNAVLQPDRRTVVAFYESGGCSHLAAARATLSGRVVTVAVEVGTDPDLPEDVGCTADLDLGYTLVRLPAPAPPGAIVALAPCDPRTRCF